MVFKWEWKLSIKSKDWGHAPTTGRTDARPEAFSAAHFNIAGGHMPLRIGNGKFPEVKDAGR